MDLIWGEAVASTDAWFGRLDGVLLVLEAHRVTHLIVKRRTLFSLFPKRIAVPLERLRRCCDGEGIYLDAPASELSSLPAARDTPGEQFICALDSRTTVLPQNSRGLRLRGLRLSESGGQVSHLIASPGPARPGVLLPADTVTTFAQGQVVLGVGKAALEGLPAYRQDRHIEADLWEALYSSPSVSDTDLKGVEAQVEEGVVTLRGNVRDSSAVTGIVKPARSVDGVAEVRSELVSDWEVELAVAAYISREAHELAGCIWAHSQLGRVSLMGHAPSDEARAALVSGVSALAGVRGVEDAIEVRPAPLPAPGEDDVVEESAEA